MHNIKFNSGRIFLLSWLIVPLLALWITTNYIVGLTHKPDWTNQASATIPSTAVAQIPGPAIAPLNWNHGPLITLWFDDAWQSQFTQGYSAMQAHGLTGALAVPTGFVGDDDYMGWSQIQLLQHQGWEITSHTVHHNCNPAQLTPQYVDGELRDAKTDLANHGVSVTNFVTPCGVSNTDIAADAKKYYSSLRSTDSGLNQLPITTPYNLKAETIVRTTTSADIANWIDEAKSTNSWLILVFHQVDTSQSEYSTTPAMLGEILDTVKASGVQVALPTQALEVSAQ